MSEKRSLLSNNNNIKNKHLTCRFQNVSRVILFSSPNKFAKEILLKSVLLDEGTEAQEGFITYPGAQSHK